MRQEQGDLVGRVALVTGASRGVGAAAAHELAARGAHVAVNFLNNVDAASHVVAGIQDRGGRAVLAQGDVTDPAEVRGVVDRAVDELGPVDVLVSNASIGHHQAPFVEQTWEQFADKYVGELQAAFQVTQAVVAGMRERRWGRLIYVSSEHARGPIAPGMLATGTAKAALDTFAVYLAHELGRDGITANVVSPGMVTTVLDAPNLPPGWGDTVTAATPLGRIASPEDVARVIGLFAGADGDYLTGVRAPVDGGMGLAQLAFVQPRHAQPTPQAAR